MDCGILKFMTHERAYSLRWLHVIGPSAMLFYFLAWFIGPILTAATHNDAFMFLNRLIGYFVFYWTLADDKVREWSYPDPIEQMLGITVVSHYYDEIAWFGVVFALAALLLIPAGIVVFLWSLRRRETWPAIRASGIGPTFTVAIAWMALLLAALLLSLAHLDLYETYFENPTGNRHHNYPPDPLSSPRPFLVAAGVMLAFTLIAVAVVQRRLMRFWRLERQSYWLLAGAFVVLVWAGIAKQTVLTDMDHRDPIYNAKFLATSVLLWAWTCRVILLFNFARFKRDALLKPDASCFACGYDLRESRHQPSCPECGAAIPVLQKP